jgi:hypothetical protein
MLQDYVQGPGTSSKGTIRLVQVTAGTHEHVWEVKDFDTRNAVTAFNETLVRCHQ